MTQKEFYKKYEKAIKKYVKKHYKTDSWFVMAKNLTEKLKHTVTEDYLRKVIAKNLNINKYKEKQRDMNNRTKEIEKFAYNTYDISLAKKLGISIETLRRHRRAIGLKKDCSWRIPENPTDAQCQQMIKILKKHHKLQGLKVTKDEELPVNMLIDAMSLMTKVTSKLDVWEHEASIEKTIKELSYLEWILLYFIGDLHIGSRYTKIDIITDNFKRFQDTNGLLLAHVGDGTDNFLANHHPTGLYEQICSPQDARRIWRYLWNSVYDKTLFMVSGCHDLFSKQQADMDMVEEFSELYKIKYLGSGGKIFLNLAGIVYNIFAKHKSRWNSGENPFHACIKNILYEFSNADICCIAHNHLSGIAELDIQGKRRILVRSGTCKLFDQFSKKIGYTKNDYGSWITGVVLNTQRKELRTVNSIDEGLKQIKLLNGKRWI